MDLPPLGLHSCEHCVPIYPLPYSLGYPELLDGEEGNPLAGTSDPDGNQDNGSLTSPYLHCLLDDDTLQAARAAAAVAEQLMHQQELLIGAIDYSLVYALHSFVANLEGQVCVLKGDPLALLDDSNSYWWLVRCCKTEEIGYIPAENIETPSERLARLNRIRNVQLALVSQPDFSPQQPRRNNKAAAPKPKNALVFAEKPTVFIAHNLGEDYDDDDEDLIDSAGNGAGGDGKDTGAREMETNVADGDKEMYESPQASVASIDQDNGSKRTSFWSKFNKTLAKPPSVEVNPRRGRSNSVDMSAGIRGKSASRTRAAAEVQGKSAIDSRHNSVTAASATTSRPETIRVLRIYSGNVDLNATFKTVVWNEDTTVGALLETAIRRFKVSNSASGEYYLSILHFDSQERKLPECENIQHVLEVLSNKKLPGLSTFKKVTKVLNGENNAAAILINDDQIIKILINRNVNVVERNNIRLVRVCMYDEADVTGIARTSKTLSVGADVNVAGLLELARKKFKVGQDKESNYRLMTACNGEESLREASESVHEILRDEANGLEELEFILRQFPVEKSQSHATPNGIPLPERQDSNQIQSNRYHTSPTEAAPDSATSNSPSIASYSVLDNAARASPIVASPRLSLVNAGSPLQPHLESDTLSPASRSRFSYLNTANSSPPTSNRLSVSSSSISSMAIPEPSTSISIAPVQISRTRPASSTRLSSLMGLDGQSLSSRKGSIASNDTMRQKYDELERDLELFVGSVEEEHRRRSVAESIRGSV